MPDKSLSTPHHLLREYLRRDSPRRERAVARFVGTAAVACIPFTLGLVLVEGWRTPLFYIAFALSVATYELLLVRALYNGWYHPIIPWLNAFIEVSLPLPILV